MTRSLPLIAFMPLILAACTDRNGQDEALGGGCEDTLTPLAADEASPLGFSAEDALPAVMGDMPFSEALLWEGGAEDTITLEVVYDGGEVNYVDSEPAESEGEINTMEGAAAFCEDRLEVAAHILVKTLNGAFDEDWAVTISFADVGAGTMWKEFDPYALNGSFDPEPYLEEDFDTVTGQFDARLSWPSADGSLGLQGEKVDGEVAMAAMMEVASWPASEEGDDEGEGE